MVLGQPLRTSGGSLLIRWLPWCLGLGGVVAVTTVVWHVADAGTFGRLLTSARPSWLAVALVLQVATYAAQGGVWRIAVTGSQAALPWRVAFKLAVMKLFADQALPSAGVSSSVVVARALTARRVPPAAANAAVILNIVSFHFAYATALMPALWIAWPLGAPHRVVAGTAAVFVTLGVAMGTAMVRGAGHAVRLPAWMMRPHWVRSTVGFVTGAEAAVVRDPRRLLLGWSLQTLIMVCDAATMWTLVIAVGSDAAPSGVFASFMVASLFRTVAIVPAGLGTFEASSVLTLRLVGVPVAPALAASLLFRLVSSVLPMAPGFWLTWRALAARPSGADGAEAFPYWALASQDLAAQVGSSPGGLTSAEAAARRPERPERGWRAREAPSWTRAAARQLRSPLLLLLVFAAVASSVTGAWLDAGIVLAIITATVGIGCWREYRADLAVAALQARLDVRATVLRDGQLINVPIDQIVVGDVIALAAGSLVPADAVVLSSADLYVSEAVLTGESYPVLKTTGPVPAEAGLAARRNCVFLGTNVRSGTARCLVVGTGEGTAYGGIAQRLQAEPPETDFDRGLRRFGSLLTRAMLAMVSVVFVVHVILGRPPIDTLLFAVALAVGLSPELLPAILSVNLARGATLLARQGVLVRRLNAIENLGSMDVLCTDKTGTLTEGVVQLEGAYDPEGHPSPRVLALGALNAALETGIASPLDDAILQAHPLDGQTCAKRAEVPFDFVRKRVSVIVDDGANARLVTKGAVRQVLDVCAAIAGRGVLDDAERAELERVEATWTTDGVRVLGIATRVVSLQPAYSRADEHDLVFEGFLTFLDRPKDGVRDTIAGLASLGVRVKVITGDAGPVTRHVARAVGLGGDRLLTGRELDQLADDALGVAVEATDLFAEVDPRQKERIILALQHRGHAVGFLGDGVNDAPALHAADAGLSVDQAVEVAREAADFVLLERGLDVIRRGIEEGRRTFANTLKYVLMTTSANLGNMVSMAVASLALPFLPLTAGQILLNNFLSDVPAIGVADDTVDPEQVARPERWDLRFMGRYMLAFGALSSVFDLVTFAALLWWFDASPARFQTAWFVESLLTELAVALVVRTRRPCYRSRPGPVLFVLTVVTAGVALVVPFLPWAGRFGFVPLPLSLMVAIVAITTAYVLATELQKRLFYRVI